MRHHIASDEEMEPLRKEGKSFEELKRCFIGELKTKYKELYHLIQPIPYMKNKMFCVNDIYVDTAIEKKSGNNWNPTGSYFDMLSGSKVILVEADPGYGKSTLALQLAYHWYNGTLPGVDLFILIRLRQLGKIDSIFRAVKLFSLPKDSEISEEDIRNIIHNSQSVVIFFDGFDEYPDQDQDDSDVSLIMTKEKLQKATVIVTTRSMCLPNPFSGTADRFRLNGFDEEARDKYILLAVAQNQLETFQNVKHLLQNNPVLGDLSEVPLFFVMFSHMAHENNDFQTCNSVTNFFSYMIRCFHSHMKNKLSKEESVKIDQHALHHSQLDEVAFQSLVRKSKQEAQWEKRFLQRKLGDDFYTQYTRIGILLEEEIVADTDQTQPFQYKTVVRFFHKLFCEWYAAHYVADCIAEEDITSDSYLEDVFEDTRTLSEKICISTFLKDLDPFELQYVYRFACGLNKVAALKIIEYLQHSKEYHTFAYLCMLEHEGTVESILEHLKDMASNTISLKPSHSRLMQRSIIQVLTLASKNNIIIEIVLLANVLQSIDRKRGCIVLKSGLCFPIIKSLERLEIREDGREFADFDVHEILLHAAEFQQLKFIGFSGCILPRKIKNLTKRQRSNSEQVIVKWGKGLRLNLGTGLWELTQKGYRPLTKEEYEQRATEYRHKFRHTEWQKTSQEASKE